MLLVVGHVVRAHGVRGEVVVAVRTDSPEQRFAVGSVLKTQADPTRPTEASAPAPPTLTVESVRPHQGRLLITFESVSDRDAAERLRGLRLWVDADIVAPPADPDEFHDHQLVGLAATTPEGEHLGEVERIEHAPAGELLVLRRPDGRTALVPFVRAIVPEVDLAAGRLVLTPPEGLLDL